MLDIIEKIGLCLLLILILQTAIFVSILLFIVTSQLISDMLSM